MRPLFDAANDTIPVVCCCFPALNMKLQGVQPCFAIRCSHLCRQHISVAAGILKRCSTRCVTVSRSVLQLSGPERAFRVLEVYRQMRSNKPSISIRSCSGSQPLPGPCSVAVNECYPAVCCCFPVVPYSCKVCNNPV